MAEKDKDKDKDKSKLPQAAAPGQFFGTPVTMFPQYSMAGMFPQLPPAGPAQYMNGGWTLPPPTPAPTPQIPPPNPRPNRPGGGGFGGLLDRLRQRQGSQQGSLGSQMGGLIGGGYQGMSPRRGLFGGSWRANA